MPNDARRPARQRIDAALQAASAALENLRVGQSALASIEKESQVLIDTFEQASAQPRLTGVRATPRTVKLPADGTCVES